MHSTCPSFVTITSPSVRAAAQNTHQDKRHRSSHIQTAHFGFLLLLFLFLLRLPTRTIRAEVGEMEWMMVCLRVLVSFWGGPQPQCFLTHWTGKIRKNKIIFRQQVFSRVPLRRVCHLQTLEKSPQSLTLLDSQTLSLRGDMIESIRCSFMLDSVGFSVLAALTGRSVCAVGIFFYQIPNCVMPTLGFKPWADLLTYIYHIVNNSSVHL